MRSCPSVQDPHGRSLVLRGEAVEKEMFGWGTQDHYWKRNNSRGNPIHTSVGSTHCTRNFCLRPEKGTGKRTELLCR